MWGFEFSVFRRMQGTTHVSHKVFDFRHVAFMLNYVMKLLVKNERLSNVQECLTGPSNTQQEAGKKGKHHQTTTYSSLQYITLTKSPTHGPTLLMGNPKKEREKSNWRRKGKKREENKESIVPFDPKTRVQNQPLERVNLEKKRVMEKLFPAVSHPHGRTKNCLPSVSRQATTHRPPAHACPTHTHAGHTYTPTHVHTDTHILHRRYVKLTTHM